MPGSIACQMPDSEEYGAKGHERQNCRVWVLAYNPTHDCHVGRKDEEDGEASPVWEKLLPLQDEGCYQGPVVSDDALPVSQLERVVVVEEDSLKTPVYFQSRLFPLV